MAVLKLADGGALHYDVTGPESAETIVFLHGFTMDSSQWDPQIEVFAEQYRCITYDLRGFGKSSDPTGTYDHIEDFAAILEHFELTQPHVVGLSLGGLVAHVFAARYPGRMASLTLVSPGARGFIWKERRPVEVALDYGKDHTIDETKAFWMGLPLFASLDDYPQAKADVARMLDDYSGWHFANYDHQAAYPPEPGPHTIDVPTLVIRGARDVQGYYDIAKVLADSIPNACLKTYEDCGHMLSLEQPDRLNRDLGAFLSVVSKEIAQKAKKKA